MKSKKSPKSRIHVEPKRPTPAAPTAAEVEAALSTPEALAFIAAVAAVVRRLAANAENITSK